MLKFNNFVKKVNKINEGFLENKSMELFSTLAKYLTKKLDYQVTPMDYFQNIIQDDVNLKCINFITSSKKRFRINFYSKSSLTEINSYEFYSVDFWEDDEDLPSHTMKINLTTSFNIVTLVSCIYAYLANVSDLESGIIDAVIYYETEDSSRNINKSSLNESLLSDPELAEYLLMKNKYRGQKRFSMTLEEKRRFYYLALKHHFNEPDVDKIIQVQHGAVGIELDLADEEIMKDEAIIELERKLSEKVDIKTTFKHLEILIGGIARGISYSLIITGSAGVGKTQTVLDTMELLNLKVDVDYTLIKGQASPMGIYKTFYQWSKDKIIVFDDCDSVFRKEEGINILKGALDTSKYRTISWKSPKTFDPTSKTPEEIQELVDQNRYPDKIDITSSVIFITNLTKEDILKNKLLAPIMSRSQFIEMVFTEEDIVSRIAELVPDIQVLDMSIEEKQEVLDVLVKVVKAGKITKELNLRTFISMCKAKYNLELHIATCKMEGRDPGVDEDDWIYYSARYSS